VDPVPDPLLLRKNLVAPGIEPGPLDIYTLMSGYRQHILMDSTAHCLLMSVVLTDVRRHSQFWCYENVCSFLSSYCGFSVSL
jgi:hypothetical protein